MRYDLAAMTEPSTRPDCEVKSPPNLHATADADQVRREERLRTVNEDVAELRRVMERLFHWAAVIESSDDAIFGKTLDGIITSWNYGAERIYGYRAEEIVGRSVAILFPTDRADEFDQIMSRLQQGERLDHYETIRVRRDGSTLDISVTISPIRDLEGRLIGVSSIGRDITERKRLEQRRTAFAAAASHELKTPITVQKMAVQSLRRAIDRGNPAALPRLLERLEESLTHQTRIVDGLLDLARLEQKTLVAHPARFGLDELAEEAVEQLRPLTHHALLIEAPDSLPVMADRDQVRQILENLLTNAIKYSPEADRVEITLAEADGWATVAIRDFGIGLAAADQERIFDPFVRVQGSPIGAPAGMGLGLYLAAHLTELQGGRLEVTSAPGDGSTFTLRLPLPTEASAVMTPPGP